MPLPPEIFPEAISPKQLVFIAMTIGYLAVAIPMALRFEWMDRVCMAGILFMAINPVDVTFFSYTAYRGDIRGIEFGVTDWLTITLIVAMLKAPRWRKRRLYTRNPNELWMGLYLAYCVLTVAIALIPQFAVFGATKLVLLAQVNDFDGGICSQLAKQPLPDSSAQVFKPQGIRVYPGINDLKLLHS